MNRKVIFAVMALYSLSLDMVYGAARFEPITGDPDRLVDFVTDRDGWAVTGPTEISRTEDGGYTWAVVALPHAEGLADSEINGFFPVSSLEAWVQFKRKPPIFGRTRMFRTKDGGRLWREERLPTDLLLDITSVASQNGSAWLGGIRLMNGADRVSPGCQCPERHKGGGWTPVIYYRSDPDSEWRTQSVPMPNGCPVTLLTFFDRRRGVAVAQNSIYFTEDAGLHWTESAVRMLQSSAHWHAVEREPPQTLQFLGKDGRLGWVSYGDGDLYKTVDGGRHWRQLIGRQQFSKPGAGFGQWGASHFATEKVGWVLQTEAVYETRDGGATWTRLDAPERIFTLSGAGGLCRVAGLKTVYRLRWDAGHP